MNQSAVQSVSSSYWLLKTEPHVYSFAQLQKDKSTHWNGVRNFQARNYLKQIRKNDFALIYHSGDEKAVVGIAQVSKEAYPDPDPLKAGEWVQVDLIPFQPLKQSITLAQIKSTPELMTLPLIKQSRLSVMPITEKHYRMLLELGNAQE